MYNYVGILLCADFFVMTQGAVRKLVKQSLLQLGQLSDDAEPRLVWRSGRSSNRNKDLSFAQNDFWSTLRNELKTLADELKNKPRDHGKMTFLGEMAAYAGQWDSKSHVVAMEFASIARNWANDLKKSIDSTDAVSPEDQHMIASQRAKCCLFYMYAIVCYAGSVKLSVHDAQEICGLSILAESCRLFEDPTPYDVVVRSLTVFTKEILAARMRELMIILRKDTQILDSAVKHVLQQAPKVLQWKRLSIDGKSTNCFDAESAEGDLYSINLLTGTVLFNGLQPTRLPNSILNNLLYQRTFPNRVFEVVLTDDGKLQTIRTIQGFRYNFFFDRSERLIIQEAKVWQNDEESYENNSEFELLDGTLNQVQSWGIDLPIRLQCMYSHWYCRALKCITLRPHVFNQHAVHFLLLNADQTSSWDCYQVPDHLKDEDVSHLLSETRLSTFDRLVLVSNDSAVFEIMSHFDSPSFIHTFLSSHDTKNLIFEFPRFDLSFELLDGKLHSRDYLGYFLAPCQQLDNHLLGFENYMILQQNDSRFACDKIIVPVGTITQCKGKIAIGKSPDAGCVLHVHAYDMHRRLNSLEASSVEARLQLASLYAATGSLLPEHGSKVSLCTCVCVRACCCVCVMTVWMPFISMITLSCA